MVTVKKVAELANVSPSTVSRVINGAENVNPEIRERVKKVISETGYFPNNAARSLVNRKTGAIAVLIRNLHKPFFYDLLRGMKDAATAMHKCVLFCNLSDEKEERNKYMPFLTNGIVDSMILYGTLYTDWPIIENLSSSRFPFILIENNFDYSQFNQILINNFDGAMNAVRFLAENGHERIVLFMGNPNKKVNLERLNGYQRAMTECGFTLNPDNIVNIFGDSSQAFDAAQAIMRMPDEKRPTAIFTTSDKIAVQAIKGILSLGFRVPEDISVMTFDSQSHLEEEYKGPTLTGIKQPLYDVGYESISAISEIMDGKIKPPYSRTYETTIQKGETVRNLNEG